MRKPISIALILILLLGLLTGCSVVMPRPPVGLQNAWTDYASLREAEKAVGFTLDVPEKIRHYRAQSFRVMDGQLLEVVYQNGDSQVILRKMRGENQDLSGNYNSFAHTLVVDADIWKNVIKTQGGIMLNLISGEHFSYSLDAPEGYVGDANRVFIRYICVDHHA